MSYRLEIRYSGCPFWVVEAVTRTLEQAKALAARLKEMLQQHLIAARIGVEGE